MFSRPLPCRRSSDRPRLWVRKLGAAGEERYRYPAAVLWRGAESVTVAATFRLADTVVGGLLLARGDCFVETYFLNRWYNILAVYASESGRLRGWYVNIGAPAAVAEQSIAYRDLALDLVVLADGRQVVLDEDEFRALTLDTATRAHAWDALSAVRRRFRRLCAAARLAR